MELDEKTVAALAGLAGLSLETEERAALTPRLRSLLGGADTVNAFMGPRRAVGPAVRFKHREPPEAGEV
jgi:Asp-tRNA(Asn)/Glu-tRNA(Gln) amidotransferase C subunit